MNDWINDEWINIKLIEFFVWLIHVYYYFYLFFFFDSRAFKLHFKGVCELAGIKGVKFSIGSHFGVIEIFLQQREINEL